MCKYLLFGGAVSHFGLLVIRIKVGFGYQGSTLSIDYSTRIGMHSNNNGFTLYTVILMCGPAFQMETFMM